MNVFARKGRLDVNPETLTKGCIEYVNAEKGYGFIKSNAGRKNNIHFQFGKIVTTPNSFASHKLLAIAHKLNKQSSVVEALFYSYFIEGIDIGNMEQLIIIAKQHNIYNDKTLQYLKSDEDEDNLLAEEIQARELGIKGVPCFIINRKFVLFGAQDKKNFLDIFHKINK